MPSRKRNLGQEVEPDLTDEQALPLFKKQLQDLQGLKNHPYREIKDPEQEWRNLTERLIERKYGKPSTTLNNFYSARRAGAYGGLRIARSWDEVYDENAEEKQHAFEERTKAFESLLKSIISEIEALLPKAQIKGVYEPAEAYAFYNDLKSKIEQAQQEIFIADNYIDDKIFRIYVNDIPNGLKVRLLTLKISSAVQPVASMYFANHTNFELRTTNDGHDRMIFIDDRCWISGASIKDAANKKPTYLIEVENVSAWRRLYEDIWSKATPVAL